MAEESGGGDTGEGADPEAELPGAGAAEQVSDDRSVERHHSQADEEIDTVVKSPDEKQLGKHRTGVSRPKRVMAGKHSNLHRLPRSVRVSSVVGLLRELLRVLG